MQITKDPAYLHHAGKPVVTLWGFGFVTYEGLPSDFYMKLAGHASRMLRGQVPVTDDVPQLSTLTKENTR